MAAMPPPPPPPPGHHGAGPSHYNDENAGVDLSESSGRDLEHVFNNITHHVNAGREEAARFMAAVRMERENELFDQNIRRHVQDHRQRREGFDRNNRIPPYVSPPLQPLYPELAGLAIRTQFNSNGVNPR